MMILPLKKPPLPHHDCESLITIFNDTLGATYATRLIKGGDEPEYIPADGLGGLHQIIFTQDYFSSALHEVSHWCVAGEQRRLLHDYGYWYAPDGRTAQQQANFERVEVKPQALEWLFSRACGVRFRVSADNLASNLGASEEFKAAIHQQVHDYCNGSLNTRAREFIMQLAHFHRVSNPFDKKQYLLADLV